jgi:metal-responsive CopG/Arc/MetJ family transcriptional regulator
VKTAVSIPDDVFEGGERLARQTKKSRSQLYGDALREYIARHTSEEITDAMNRVCLELERHPGEKRDEFVSLAGHRILERTDW